MQTPTQTPTQTQKPLPPKLQALAEKLQADPRLAQALLAAARKANASPATI